MSSDHGDHGDGSSTEGFMKEIDIWPAFEGHQKESKSKDSLIPELEKWCGNTEHDPRLYHHDAKIGGDDGFYTCDTIVDKWCEWFSKLSKESNPHTNPGKAYSDSNSFLLKDEKKNTSVYFATASPFREPDFKAITLTERASLLIPVYNVLNSTQFFPSLNDDKKLTELTFKDLCGIKEINASFDGEPIIGCCVIRNTSAEFPIADQDNVFDIPQEKLVGPSAKINLCHGGFWLLFKEKTLTPGEHLLKFTAKSKNYEIDAKILIIVLR
jgi:hypothetical protein